MLCCNNSQESQRGLFPIPGNTKQRAIVTEHSPIQQARNLWHKQRVKRLIRAHIATGAACLISVRETQCTDPECPGPATEIRIMDLGLRDLRFTLHKPLSDLSAKDIAAALSK